MFSFFGSHGLQKVLTAGLIALNSMSASAELTSYSSNGVDLVYSSVSDVTWTKDANLLGTLINAQDYSTVVNAILSISPTVTHTPNLIYPEERYTLSSADFSESIVGGVSWFGAMGLVNYLNHIQYGGSSEWYLPTKSSDDVLLDMPGNGAEAGEEFSELFYKELEGVSGRNIVDTKIFVNQQIWAYWTGSEFGPYPNRAWQFFTNDGYYYRLPKANHFYAWLVTPGQITAVPEPQGAAMLLAGLVLLGISMSWNKQSQRP